MQKTLFTVICGFIITLSFGQDAAELNKRSKEFLDKEDFKSAVPLIKEAAERGNAEAQYHYGEVIKGGIEVPQNDSLAFLWFLKAADQGWAKAQLSVAIVTWKEKSVSQIFPKLLYG